MSSGTKQLVINSRERAVSDDINRLQSFAGADMGELLRNLFAGATANIGLDQLGAPPSANSAPNPAVIFNGICAQPQLASVNLFITAGELFVVDPELVVSSDDSPAHLIDDPGINAGGVLTFTPNATLLQRIDVVEFARVRSDRDGAGTLDTASLAIETSSRDIYNTVTGAFAPATVTKVYNFGRLTYRIRTGTAGAGFPGAVSGWTPIMIASVPAGATTWDQAVCWDVRPMAEDYVPREQPHTDGSVFRTLIDESTTLFGDGAGGNMLGSVKGSFTNFRIGGVIPSGGYNFNGRGGYRDIATGTLAQGTALVNNQPYYVWLTFPYGLPRWMELDQASSLDRKPCGFRGIPIASQDVIPGDNLGTPSSNLPFPAWTGLPGTVAQGALIAAGVVQDDGGGLQNIFPPITTGRRQMMGLLEFPVTAVGGGVYTANLNDNLVSGPNQPIGPNVRRLRVAISAPLLVGNNQSGSALMNIVSLTPIPLTLCLQGTEQVSDLFTNATSGNIPVNLDAEIDAWVGNQYSGAGSGSATRTLQMTTSLDSGIANNGPPIVSVREIEFA